MGNNNHGNFRLRLTLHTFCLLFLKNEFRFFFNVNKYLKLVKASVNINIEVATIILFC